MKQRQGHEAAHATFIPTIVVAEQAGACYGVQRALDMVEQAASEAPGPVRTLGPLIHNPQVVASLEQRGVAVTEEVPHDAGSTLVLRTHGVVPAIVNEAKGRGLNVIDATCPYVKRVHAAAERLEREGYQVIVVGEAGHPEVEAILGHAEGAVAVADADALAQLSLSPKVGVVVQTTQAKARLDEVVCALTGLVREVCVVNTICAATSERQGSAAHLAAESDVMVVIGGRNSANTTRLAEICSACCPHTHHIEVPSELRPEWFEGATSIGVTAGASTPVSKIDEVVDAIRSICSPEDD